MTRDGAKFWWGMELPKEIAYMIKEIKDTEFHPVTYKEIFARKKAQQDARISMKREHEVVRPCAVWVFFNEHGINDMFFKGWWIYLRTLRGDYALNFRNERKDLILQIKQLFPCGCIPFDAEYDELWFSSFEKQYHRTGKRKRNAIAFARCQFNEHGRITRIFR